MREALRVLESQGLVQVRHGYGGGVFVADVASAPVLGALETSLQLGQLDVDELYEVRVLFEPTVVRLAVERGDRALADRLAENVARARSMLAQEATAFPANLEFHALLAQAAGNRVLSLVMQALVELLERLHHDYPTTRTVSRRAWQDHHQLAEAVRSRDAKRAQALMVAHLRGLKAQFSLIQERLTRDRLSKSRTIRPWRGVRLESARPNGPPR